MSSFFVVLQSMNVLNVFLDKMHQKIILKDLKSIFFVHSKDVNVGAQYFQRFYYLRNSEKMI